MLSPYCYWKENPDPVPGVCDACGKWVKWTIPHEGGRYGESCYLSLFNR